MTAQAWLPQAVTALRPVGMTNLSARGQAQLLDTGFSRLRSSVYVMPVIALLLLAYLGWRTGAVPVLAWGLGYVFLAFVVHRLARRYLDDQGRLAPDALVKRWLSRVQALAWLHGAGVSFLAITLAPDDSLEFRMLLYMIIAYIVSTNTVNLTQTIGLFLRFFACSWHVPLLLMYWIFPDLWHIMIPLGLLYSLVIYRHALTSHRFAIEQVQLKEHSELLAEQFRAAKEQAEVALQEKNLFLTTASHDLRQPIHAMSMLVEAIMLRTPHTAV
ncbi:MAG: hybrid sensor histidine kinase/response regulator, partial [Polaromonas sp.]|nr:hybrid sensor histidine kinase/response regulator [Polaromonas sp.]